MKALILKIKEFHKKIANNVEQSLWYGFSETDKGIGIKLPTFRGDILKNIFFFCVIWRKQQKLVKKPRKE